MLPFLALHPFAELLFEERFSDIDFEYKTLDSGIGRIVRQSTGAGVGSGREFIEGQAGEGGAVISFNIAGIKAEGRCAVPTAGAVVLCLEAGYKLQAETIELHDAPAAIEANKIEKKTYLFLNYTKPC